MIQGLRNFLRTLNKYAKERSTALHFQENLCVCRAAGDSYCGLEIPRRENEIFNLHSAFNSIILCYYFVIILTFSLKADKISKKIFPTVPEWSTMSNTLLIYGLVI